MKIVKQILYSIFFFSLLQGQTASLVPPIPDSLFIRIQLPERDSIVWRYSKIRFAACTQPTAKAYVNFMPVKVFPTGAIAGVTSLSYGKNILRFTVISEKGDSLWRELTIIRPEPPPPLSADTLRIDENSLEPSQDLWLTYGDIIEVKMKGSPGMEAYFDIPEIASDIRMEELTSKAQNSSKGIYVGRYIIKPGDNITERHIVFHLKKSFWSKEEAISKGKISISANEFPRIAEIVGKRPYLNLSLEGDRLGGAKLGFLETGIRVPVTGKVGAFYRIQLSNSLSAWLPEEFAMLLPTSTPLPRSNVGAITATGNSTHDIITVSLDERLPYTSEQIQSPTSISIDLYGATSNTNWIIQDQFAKEVSSITCTQVEDRRYRLLITLRSKFHWGYDISYTGTTLRIKIARPPLIQKKDTPLAGLTIAVDAGHGGEDNRGAIGATGALEKDITFAIAQEVKDKLISRGAKAYLTRTETNTPPTADRFEDVLNSNPTILISIHCNSCGETSDPFKARGTSVYYKHIGFRPLAEIMYSKLLSTGLQPYGIIGNFNFLLNSLTQVPNVLIETAFLSNPEDEMYLLDSQFRSSVAQQIVSGLEEYVRVASN
jgi:N-acetylmuramoyl-L-alanine amidase